MVVVVVVTRVVVVATVELVDGGAVVVVEVPDVHAPIRATTMIPANLPGRTR
jgi:1-deoxy-D-xylulose 5-phosphate reductoisomerase